MAMVNRFGLSRNIPESIKEVVRKRDGFGCVHCGKGIYTYEHFNPLFKDAQQHQIEGIALLCGQCQLQTTKGILSKYTISLDVNDPFCKRAGFTNDFLDLTFPLLLYFGNFVYPVPDDNREHIMLMLDDEPALACSKDPVGGPVQISAVFHDRNNRICLQITKNEWKANSESWDIIQQGRKLSIYEEKRKVGIELEFEPPNIIRFNRLTTFFNKNRLEINKHQMSILRSDGKLLEVGTPESITRAATIFINPWGHSSSHSSNLNF